MAQVRDLLQNLQTMTASDSALSSSFGNVQALTDKLKGPGGGLGVLLGSDAEAKKLLATLERTNTLLARLDGLAVKADAQVFGKDGVMPHANASVQQLNALLAEARTSLKKADTILDRREGDQRQRQDRDGRPRLLARAGGGEPAQRRCADPRSQPQVAVRAQHRGEAAMSRNLVASAFALGLAACSSTPPPPDWQSNSKTAIETLGRCLPERRRAHRDARIRSCAQRGRAHRALGTWWRASSCCAAPAASPASCSSRAPVFEALRDQADPAERAYADYLAGRAAPQDLAQLPEAQRGGAPKDIADPLARLVADRRAFRDQPRRSGRDPACSRHRLGAGLAAPAARLAGRSAQTRRSGRSGRRSAAPAPAHRVGCGAAEERVTPPCGAGSRAG